MPRRTWLLLHEPRVITAIVGAMWLILIYIGLAALLSPPMTIAHEIGPRLTTWWGTILLVGGILGLIGCLPGWWWVERTGIILTGAGVACYGGVVTMLHVMEAGGSRLVQLGFILLAIGHLINRWCRIRGAQVDPTRGVRPHVG